ncbi:NAD-dependent epimerase/dehydratase family protein [Actinoalloteichus hymeniacidonis]|uniref:Saccharopine dehydrogenase n=1 Tax=Actinoalloteichus hymeniacidonis TaxID=340345 RepID=A0AAC9HLJ9_9PSEU|nr:NAD-dependent epimerase/dehydratase family protein [Actinoalloteichus hymeniacidonis]AOS61522.1 Saccharopine dehydrogenase [Actinoalloteichus hymeniacidonis]MBB5910470.1 hypothetical protein [Actinoalloteichus hymeniacidonis]
MRIVVAGGTGILGRAICSEVRAVVPDAELLIGTRRSGASDGLAGDLGPQARMVSLDVRDSVSIRDAVAGADLVIVAVAQSAPLVQRICLESGVHSVDVGVQPEFAARVRELDRPATDAGLAVVAMAGLFPGLSGLAVREAVDGCDAIDGVDVFFRQNTNARVGRAGTIDMLEIVSTPVRRERAPDRGSRAEQGMRLIEHPERGVVAAGLGLADVEYRTAWNSRAFNSLVAGLIALRVLPRFAPQIAGLAKHDPAKAEDVELWVRARGVSEGRPVQRLVRLSAVSDYGATAGVAVALGIFALRGEITGAGVPFQLTTLSSVIAGMRDGLVVSESD